MCINAEVGFNYNYNVPVREPSGTEEGHPSGSSRLQAGQHPTLCVHSLSSCQAGKLGNKHPKRRCTPRAHTNNSGSHLRLPACYECGPPTRHVPLLHPFDGAMLCSTLSRTSDKGEIG